MNNRRRNRRNRGIELGVLLLVFDMMNIGFREIPPVTLCTILGQICLYMNVINVPWQKSEVCLSSNTILKDREYKRFFISAVEHADDFHLYYNMISFLLKGRTLERRYGSCNFALLLSILAIMTNVFYIVLGVMGTRILDDPYYMATCAIGFSGVIFSLKVLTTSEAPNETTHIAGFSVPNRYASWVELILIQMMVPRASFLGHLAGILAGTVYVHTPLGRVIRDFIQGISGEPFVH